MVEKLFIGKFPLKSFVKKPFTSKNEEICNDLHALVESTWNFVEIFYTLALNTDRYLEEKRSSVVRLNINKNSAPKLLNYHRG